MTGPERAGYASDGGAESAPVIPTSDSPNIGTDHARPVGRCIGCFHDFATGPCGGCGAVSGKDCPSCGGSGDAVGFSFATRRPMMTDCADCDGSGYRGEASNG